MQVIPLDTPLKDMCWDQSCLNWIIGDWGEGLEVETPILSFFFVLV